MKITNKTNQKTCNFICLFLFLFYFSVRKIQSAKSTKATMTKTFAEKLDNLITNNNL